MGFIFDPYSPAYNTIIVFVVIIIIILVTKPNFMYDKKRHKFKQFGCGHRKTLLPFNLVSIILCIIIYILFSLVETLFCGKTTKIKKVGNKIHI